MTKYFKQIESIKKIYEREKENIHSAKTVCELLEAEFKASVGDGPGAIYGDWEQHLRYCQSLSRRFFNPDVETPTTVGISKESKEHTWVNLIPFCEQQHMEILWFLERGRVSLERDANEYYLTPNERVFKEKASGAMLRGNRLKALYLIKEALATNPNDYIIYCDMGFLLLNDNKNVASGMEHFRIACKLLPRKRSDTYCFIMLVINLIYQITNNDLSAYSTTQGLINTFSKCGEVLYQHGINAMKIEREDEGIFYIKQAFETNINYALKAYRENKDRNYREIVEQISQELLDNKRKEFEGIKAKIDGIIDEAKDLKINEWGQDIISYLRKDLNKIDVLGSSSSYANIDAAIYFIEKTTELLVSQGTKALEEKAKETEEEISKKIVEAQANLKEKLAERQTYNTVYISILSISTFVLFVFLSINNGILFGFLFSVFFAMILFSAIGFNAYKIKQLKQNTSREIKQLRIRLEKSRLSFSKQIAVFKARLRKLASN